MSSLNPLASSSPSAAGQAGSGRASNLAFRDNASKDNASKENVSRESTSREGPGAARESSHQRQQLLQGRAVLEAQQSLSLKAGNEPLRLALSAAIDRINERLAPLMGENAIERARDEGLDVSPEATAGRILDLTTGLFERFQAHHPEDDAATQRARFVDVIGEGIARGFAEAREILQGLGVLQGRIAEDVDRTQVLVQEGLERFLNAATEEA